MNYADNKEVYKQKFETKFPFLTKDVKLAGSIARFCAAVDTSNKFYRAIEDRSRIKEDGSAGELTMQDFAKFLTQINAYNETIMQVMAEIMQSVPLVTMKVKQPTKESKMEELMAGDIEPKVFIPTDACATVTSKQFRESPKLRGFFADGAIVLDSIVNEEWQGTISQDNLLAVVKYLKGVNETYAKYKDKPFKMFEFTLKINTEPRIGWRQVVDSTFRVELGLGDIFLPAPKEYINSSDINKHFASSEAIAFAYVHEFVNGVAPFATKKKWVVDEFQSDIVEHIHLLPSNPETKTWYNPEGKSRNERFKTKTENYYKDWHKVLLHVLIEKAKELGVDELWLITGKSIYEHWKSKNGFQEAQSDVDLEKTMRLFRRYYDNMALEYSKFMDPKFKAGAEDYAELIKKINSYYDSWSKVDTYRDLTTNKGQSMTEEQRAKKLEGIDITEAIKQVAGVDIGRMRARMEEVLYRDASHVETGNFPAAVYKGQYHVIDLARIP